LDSSAFSSTLLESLSLLSPLCCTLSFPFLFSDVILSVCVCVCVCVCVVCVSVYGCVYLCLYVSVSRYVNICLYVRVRMPPQLFLSLCPFLVHLRALTACRLFVSLCIWLCVFLVG
jgi:hypothetical protein